MSTIKIEVEVSKEAYELGKGIVALVDAVLKATKDGFQAGSDLPQIAVAAFSQMSAIEGIEKLADEAKANPAAFYKTIGLALADGYKTFQENQIEG